MPTVEKRIETFESILGQFIVHTELALRINNKEFDHNYIFF